MSLPRSTSTLSSAAAQCRLPTRCGAPALLHSKLCPRVGRCTQPSVSSVQSQLSAGAVPRPGCCAKAAEEQCSSCAVLGACPGTGAPLGMAWLHQLRGRDVTVRSSWEQETADKSGDCEESGLCVTHDPQLLIFSFNRTYFFSSSVKKKKKKSKLFFLKWVMVSGISLAQKNGS